MQQTGIKGYKSRHNWVGKASHWELCKRLEFHYTNKWYIHKPESILENEMPKILSDFRIRTYHLIPARMPDLVLTNKKKRTCHEADFAVPANEKENKRKQKHRQIHGYCQRA